MDLYEKRSGNQESYKKIDELNAIIGNLSLSDLNRVLYRADPEERDDGNGGGVYVLPETGALVYCGFQGMNWSVLWFIGMHCGLQSCNLLNLYFPPFTWSLFHVLCLSRVKINSTKLACFQCIDFFHNCGLWIYSFICLMISPSDLVSMCKIQKNSYFQTIPERLI